MRARVCLFLSGIVVCLALAATVATAGAAAAPSFGPAIDYWSGTAPRAVAVGDFNGDSRQDLATADSADNTVSVLLGNGDGSFQSRTDYATGTGPYSVAVGDFNGDGKLDLVTANYSANTVSVLLGNGDGGFAAKTDFATGTAPESVAVGDFNGDGKLDLVTANYSANTVSVLLGNGDGTFQSRTDYATGTGPVSVAVGDFSGDGKQDLVVANYSANTVSVLLGTGSGGFAAKTDFATGTGPRSVAVGDFNGDFRQDVVTANYNANTISVLLGNGGGGLAAKTDFAAGAGPVSVAVRDIDGDLKQDVVTANYSANTISVLLGNGGGGFAAKTDFAAGVGPLSIAAGDLDSDGRLDLVTANYSANTVSAMLGKLPASGSGFAAKIDSATGYDPYAVAVGDFNGDGKLDVVTPQYWSLRVSVLLGNGTGGFAAETDFATGDEPMSIAVGDFNGDGRPDIATANGYGTVSVLLGNGNGTFRTDTDFITGAGPVSVAVGDFNGDGRQDLVTANSSSNTISVLLGNGNGGFAAKTDFATGTGPRSVAVADLNGDGRADCVTANSSQNSISVLLGNGDGTFQSRTDFLVGSSGPSSVAVGDFNGDGKPDVVTNAGTNTVTVLLGNGSGGFTAKTTFATGASPGSVAVADFNGDGKLDLVTANEGASTVSVLLGNGSGGFGAKTDFATGALPVSAAVGDFDGDGKPDVVTADNTDRAVSVLLDRYPLSGSSSMTINDGATWAPSLTVTINSAVRGASQLRVRQLNGTWGSWQAYSPAVSWTMPSGEDNPTVQVDYRDRHGSELLLSDDILVDTIPPATSDNAPVGWQTSDVTVTLTPTDAASGMSGGLAKTEYKLDGASAWSTGTSVLVSGSGVHTIVYRSTDAAGCVESDKTAYVDIDLTPPVTTTDAGWYSSDKLVQFLAVDPLSGVASTFFTVDGGATESGLSTTIPAPADHSNDGIHDVECWSIDNVGNVETAHGYSIGIDTVPPVSLVTNATPGWHNAAFVLDVQATDDRSGVATIQYSVDGGAWQDGGFTIANDGPHTVAYRAVDRAGNVEAAKTCDLAYDVTPPSTLSDAPSGWVRTAVTVHLSASDASTGVDYTEYQLDGQPWQRGTSVEVSGAGQHTLSYRSADVAGNLEAAQSCNVGIDGTAPVTTASAYGGWHAKPFDVTLSPVDRVSGVQRVTYRIDNKGWKAAGKAGSSDLWSVHFAAPTNHSYDGIHTLRFRSVDAAGNVEAVKSCLVHIDTTRPRPSAPHAAKVIRGRTATLPYRVADDVGDHVAVTIVLRDAWGDLERTWHISGAHVNRTLTKRFTCKLAVGRYRFAIKASDRAGNTQSRIASNSLTVMPASDPYLKIKSTAKLSDAGWTKVRKVKLLFGPMAGAGWHVRARNSGGYWGAWHSCAYAGSMGWTLPSGDGAKSVTLQYSNGASTKTRARTIKLDTKAPKILFTDAYENADGELVGVVRAKDNMSSFMAGGECYDGSSTTDSYADGWTKSGSAATWVLLEPPVGSTNITFYVWDHAGNVSEAGGVFAGPRLNVSRK